MPAVGAQVIIIGIPITIQKVSNGGLSSLFNVIIESVHIEMIDTDINVTLTEADKKELKQLAANSNIFDMLIQSTAPAILGYSEIKLALLASAVSGPNQRFPNGGHFRGYIHVAICGDPGTGKTELVEDIRRKVPRSQYAAGKQTSVAGLTVTAIRDELSGSGYTAQAGALVLADKGLMIIDEIDKFEREDIQTLNTVMERGSFEYHKGGINQTFNARCPIIAVGNPKDIRFDKYEEDLSKQIDIPSDTISRFDLIFKIQDIPEPDRDRKIAEHIDKLLGQVGAGSTKEKVELPISIETMQKYLAYAKTFEPVVPEDVAKRTTGYYLELRQSKDGTISATARDKYGLIRLTKSIAKLRLSNECNIEDVDRAIAIHKSALEAIKDPTTGNPDIDILFGMGKSQRDRIKIVREIIQELQSSDGGRAFFDDIVSIAAGKSITKDQAVDILEHLKKQGDIIEIKNDCYKVA